jgi:UDP-3-O-[3-hydroxymyristoyl] glucosamine N-acyltransferase
LTSLKLRELAERLDCRLEGPESGDLEITRVAAVDAAQPGDLTFVANTRYLSLLPETRASAVILGDDGPRSAPCAVLRAPQPRLAFARAIDVLLPAVPIERGVSPLASVAPDAELGPDVSIGPFAVIGSRAVIGARAVVHAHGVVGPGARIGEDSILHPRVSVRERVMLGRRVVVQDGAVIGSDGFGFERQADGEHFKMPQRGEVVIEDDVEIGANTTIDRPAVGETRIKAGAKIDNLVQIAHGVNVGRRALLAAQVGVAGSTVIEEDVVLAGQVGVAGHLRLGRGVVATAQTGIPNSVAPGEFISGYPAIANREWLKSSAIFRQLPALKKRVVELEQRIAELEEQLAQCRTSRDR